MSREKALELAVQWSIGIKYQSDAKSVVDIAREFLVFLNPAEDNSQKESLVKNKKPESKRARTTA